MNAAVNMETCPPEEILAAFIDERLDAKSRLEVVQHLADCGDCRDIVIAANEYEIVNAAQDGNDNVVRIPAGRSGGSKFIPQLAAAVIVAVLFAVPSIRERLLAERSMAELMEAANALPKRSTEARLSGDSLHKDHERLRGDSNADPEIAVELAALRAEKRAARNASRANLHAAGVGHLLMKEPRKAVDALEKAATAGTPSAELLTDLAAAYLARGTKGDAELALKMANRAWTFEQTPSAAWNRALALEAAGRKQDAVAAWQAYLKLDPDSPWSKEVREEHLARLTEQ